MNLSTFTWRVTALLLVTALGACTNSTIHYNKNQVASPAVWADDGSEIAFILNSYEGPPGMTPDPGIFRHRILVQKPDGSGQRTVSPPRPYQAVKLYYMKRAGYMVVESALSDGHVKIDRVAVQDGTEIPIIETRGSALSCTEGNYLHHQVLPSPQGDLLAHAYSQRCGEMTIDFLDARNLVTEDSQTLPVTHRPTLTWHPDDYLIIALDDGKTAWQLQPHHAVMPVAYPACLNPPTSSSAISAQGKRVRMEKDKVQIETDPGIPVFGCQ